MNDSSDEAPIANMENLMTELAVPKAATSFGGSIGGGGGGGPSVTVSEIGKTREK
jgi:hypothetical protein